jgi:N-sulfoglucosamine sulfohydrolase
MIRISANLLRLSLLIALITLPGDAKAEQETNSRMARRPNILLLMAEDMSPRVGAFGDSVARTPNLDRLAAEGVRYPNVFTTAGVCAPSRAALILGMHQISTGTQNMRTADRKEGGYLAVPPPPVKAFPEILRRNGYFTYQHGKLDYQFSGALSGSGPFSIWDAEDNAGQWLDRNGDQPFFGMVNDLVTHESGLFEPLGSWPRGIFHFIMQIAQTYGRWGYTDGVVPTKPAVIRVPPYYPDIPEVRTALARQYDNIQIMDAKVGEILVQLEEDGLADSTIVIWTTDHGDGLPRAKRELFDSGIQVPMIIRWPNRLRPSDLSPGDIDLRMLSFVDLTAMILGFAKVERPDYFHGRDLLDPETPPREYIYASQDRIDDTSDRQRAVRSQRFKYIRSYRPELPGGHHSEFRDNLSIMRALYREYEAGRLNEDQRRWFEPPGQERLFDLQHDPFELHNVFEDPEYAGALEQMRRAYRAWRSRVPDWGDEPEEKMVNRFQPNGIRRTTAEPTFLTVSDKTILHSTSEGASIEVRLPGGRWRPYIEPLALAAGVTLEARAVRYGWHESNEVEWTVPSP